MSDNGYMDSSFNVLISEVLDKLGKGKEKFISIGDDATIGDAIDLMDKHDISQLPVYGEGELKGIVTETNLMKPVFQGDYSLEDSVSLALKDKFKVIDQNQLLSTVADALLQKQTVFVTKNNHIVDLLTNIDILHYISMSQNY